jgi:hypothetical protein
MAKQTIFLSASFFLFLTVQGQTTTSSSCTSVGTTTTGLTISVYDSYEECLNGGPPLGSAALIANDGSTCQTISSSTVADNIHNLFPGTYRAECIDVTSIRFLDSACLSGTCSSSNSNTCTCNDTSAGYIYARHNYRATVQLGISNA